MVNTCSLHFPILFLCNRHKHEPDQASAASPGKILSNHRFCQFHQHIRFLVFLQSNPILPARHQHHIPIIATKDTAAGKFIEKENLGWSIEYNQEALKQCLHNILQNPALLQEKRESEISAYEANTWKARAKQVILDLK